MDKKEEKGSSPEEKLKKIFLWVTVAAGVVVLALLLVYAPDTDNTDRFKGALSKPVSDAKETSEKPPVSMKVLDELELFPDEGRDHVDEGTKVIYKTEPPTSGLHYARWLPAGVYEMDQTRSEVLVHNLEHGNVVIYFDRDRLPKADLDTLMELPKKYAGQWDGVVLVAQKGIPEPLILTAWRVKMPIKAYDSKKVEDFLDSFRGRGPENPIR